MSSLNDISNLNESLTQGGKYTSNKSDLLGSVTELQENANVSIQLLFWTGNKCMFLKSTSRCKK